MIFSDFGNLLLLTQNFRKDFGKFSVVRIGKVSQFRDIPNHIIKPNYYDTGIPVTGPSLPEIKSKEQISRMRDSCKLAANILKKVGQTLRVRRIFTSFCYRFNKMLQVGQTTDEIDAFVHQITVENNAYPSPLRYKNFPKSVCTSVNNVACHGIPDDRPLHDGDIINIDITVINLIFCFHYKNPLSRLITITYTINKKHNIKLLQQAIIT